MISPAETLLDIEGSLEKGHKYSAGFAGTQSYHLLTVVLE